MIELPTPRIAALLENRDEAGARQIALDHDYRSADLIESGLRLAAVMLHTAPSYDNVHIEYDTSDGTAYDLWLDALRIENPYLAHILTNWVTITRTQFGLYPIYLYNRDFGRARALFDIFLRRDFPPPPYLFLLLLNGLHHAAGLPYEEIAPHYGKNFEALVPYFHRLFAGHGFDDWFARAKQGLRYYGGATNTILGLYDENFTDPASGGALFNREAEAYFDLGGGFNTPETERLIGRRFTSADIVSPRYADYDEEIVLLGLNADKTRRVVCGEERAQFLAHQRSVEYLPFDVHTDHFPDHHKSYGIVSTGFMTSTVRPQQHQSDWLGEGKGYGHVGLSIQAMIRVLELVQKGKAVDLFTVQRAGSRVYKYKTCLLQWRDGRLITLMTTDDTENHNRFTEDKLKRVHDMVRPSNWTFSDYFGR